MWEAIRQNRRRSWVLILAMGIVLAALGVAIGTYVDPQIGGILGAAAAIFIWLMLWLTATFGDRVLLSGSGAREISKPDAPQLWNIVEEMTIAAGLPKPPRIFVIDDDAPNAFAVGRSPKGACVAVTSGLLRRLNRDELQGVIAHEIGHISNLDIRFMTLAAVMLGSIVLLSDVFLRSLFYGGGRRRSSREGGGQAQIVALVIALALAVLGPIFAQLLYFACSRRREFLADASSARFTRYPEGLASALEKIASAAPGARKVNRAIAPLYIINPLQGAGSLTLFATHPPTLVRVQILRTMAGAGLAEYEQAYQRVTAAGGCIDNQSLAADSPEPIRAPSADSEDPARAVERSREALDVVNRLANYAFIACPCGVRIKVPPDSPRDTITCPRCGRSHPVPTAQPMSADSGAVEAEPPMRYQRTSTGWESFRCRCGHGLQLSPSFAGTTIICPKCNRIIEVTEAAGSEPRA
ncbi:MAG TPA: M48 family metallopeptidase [Phycisphaerae bacterium]|jgi:heat shock protein HtpX